MMAKKLYSLTGNSQKLDGGAMFGNAPKAMWQKWVEVDEENRIELGCRALLVKDDDRWLLFETGIGAFFEPKLKQRFGVVESEHVLLQSLAQIGLTHTDIDYVVLSHLHFDHAGGLLAAWEQDKPAQLLFPNAQYIVGEAHWQRAQQPHMRDRASFIPELNKLLQDSGRLHLIDSDKTALLGDDYRFIVSDGHTPGMLMTQIHLHENISVTFAADLIPAHPWVHLPITMGYDRYPEQLIDEKRALLEQLQQTSSWLFYTHDKQYAMSRVATDERGRFSALDLMPSLFEFS